MSQSRSRNVRRAAVGVVALGVIAAAGACSSKSSSSHESGDSGTGGQHDSGGTAPSAGGIAGVVTDSTGKVLSGVAVSVGSSSAMTLPNGTFTLSGTEGSNLIVSFSKTGYLPSSKAVTATKGVTAHVAAALMPMAATQPLDATNGGTVTGTGGATLQAGPSVLVDMNGNPVTGSVDVALTPLNPTDPGQLAAYPGSLIGSTGSGTPTLLQTFGVLDVTVSQNGNPVQVASGQTVTVNIPVATTGGTPLPQTEDLWSYNMTTGVWDNEGMATLNGTTYTAELAHFSYHNIDAAIHEGQATCVIGKVVDAAGNPVAGANVSPAEGSCTDALIETDSTGSYCTWMLTGGSQVITANGTAAPFGTGSVTVPGSETAIAFPGSYTCANLPCVQAPNIVINQPSCTGTSGCQTGFECCSVMGQGQCLQDFACTEAQSGINLGGSGDGGKAGSCQTDENCTGGEICCTIAASGTSTCLPQTTCSLISGGTGCSTASAVTATVAGQTYTWSCVTAESVGSEGQAEVILTGSMSSPSGLDLQVVFSSSDNFEGFSAGKTVTFAGDGGSGTVDAGGATVTVAVTGQLPGKGEVELVAESGSLEVTQFSTASGGMVAVGFSSLAVGGFVLADGGEQSVTGTLAGTAGGTVEALP